MQVIIGLTDPWRGFFFLLVRPRLWPLALLPFFLALALHVLILWFGWSVFVEYRDQWFPSDGTLWEAVAWLVSILFLIVALILAAIVFVPLVVLIAGPFNDYLSEKTEKIHRGLEVSNPCTFGSVVRAARVAVVGSTMRAVTLAVLLVFAMCFNLIPVIGHPIAVILAFYFTSRVLSMEFTSYSMERRLWTWKRQKQFIRDHRARTLGFGMMAALVMTIPLVSAAFIPASAVAGTLLFCETEGERELTANPEL